LPFSGVTRAAAAVGAPSHQTRCSVTGHSLRHSLHHSASYSSPLASPLQYTATLSLLPVTDTRNTHTPTVHTHAVATRGDGSPAPDGGRRCGRRDCCSFYCCSSFIIIIIVVIFVVLIGSLCGGGWRWGWGWGWGYSSCHQHRPGGGGRSWRDRSLLLAPSKSPGGLLRRGL
jgi:hypothetical protein